MANKNTNGQKPPYPGMGITANGNQLVSYHTEARVADASARPRRSGSSSGRPAAAGGVERRGSALARAASHHA